MISSVEACFCGRCSPTAAAHQCSACGEEIRHGVRDGVTGWWHREQVDHAPIHGHRLTRAASLEIERLRREQVWYTDDGKPYTTAEYDILKDKDVARRRQRLAELKGEDPDYREPLPEPEIRRRDVEINSFPPRSGIRQILNLIEKTDGWELTRLTHARGPYTGSSGEMLSISDTVVLNAVGPLVDGCPSVSVASWRDGKFDTAYAGVIRDGRIVVDPVNATELKQWIKETPA